MKKSSGKKKWSKSRRYHNTPAPGKRVMRWILLFIFALIFFIFFFGNDSVPKMISLMRQREALKNERMELEEENKNLDEEIRKLKNSDEYIEKIAREKHNMKKVGEEVYHISPQ